jgi:DNA-binding XRE family transcriptional regulator
MRAIFVNADIIKHLREKQLGMTQEQFASLLSVTQATVARWESGKGKPTGDAEKKLKQLISTLNDAESAEKVRQLLIEAGGLGSLAALLTLGGIGSSTVCALGVSSLFGPAGVLTSAAAFGLYKLLHISFKDK